MPILTDKPRLFVDLLDIERRENVVRTFHQATRPRRHPVLTQEVAWEKHPGMTGSVVYDEDEGVFKCWYMAGFYAPGKNHVQCLATSHDGIHWDRPEFGLHEALGSTRNNIVIPADYHDGRDHWESMLKDPLASGGQMHAGNPARYKALGWSSYDWDGPLSGIYTAWSEDGMNWSHRPEPLFHFHPRPGTDDMGPIGDAQALMIDTLRKRYVAFLRDGQHRSLSTSDDFVHWTQPRKFLNRLNEEETLYNNVGFVYGGQYLGFLTHFDRNAYAQSQTLQLLASRNGENWDRPDAEPIIPTSGVGEWDRFQIMLTGAPPVRVGDELFIYYRGTARRHNKVPGEFEPRIDLDQDEPRHTEGAAATYPTMMGIGLATIRADGFASISSSYDGGWITTRPLTLGGETLHVNVVSDYGQLLVEVLDENDTPMPGYAAAECVPVRTDSVDATVAWKNGPSLAALGERPVKLKFALRNARLYSYRCA